MAVENNPIRRIAGRVAGFFTGPTHPLEPTPPDSLLNRKVTRRGFVVGAASLGAAATLAATAGAIGGEAKPAAAQTLDAAKPTEGYKGAATAAEITHVRQDGVPVDGDGGNTNDSDATPPVVPSQGLGEQGKGQPNDGDEALAADPEAAAGQPAIQAEAPAKEKEPVKPPIFDRENGSSHPEAYESASRVYQQILSNGKEAGGVFAEAALWIESHNLNVTTTVMPGVRPTKDRLGYGSTFSIRAYTIDEIRDKSRSEPGYEQLLNLPFVYSKKMATNEKYPGVMILVHWLVLNADYLPGNDEAGDLVQLASVLKVIQVEDLEMQAKAASGANIAEVETHLASQTVQDKLGQELKTSVYGGLDKLLSANPTRWSISDKTTELLEKYRNEKQKSV